MKKYILYIVLLIFAQAALAGSIIFVDEPMAPLEQKQAIQEAPISDIQQESSSQIPWFLIIGIVVIIGIAAFVFYTLNKRYYFLRFRSYSAAVNLPKRYNKTRRRKR